MKQKANAYLLAFLLAGMLMTSGCIKMRVRGLQVKNHQVLARGIRA